MPLRYAVGLLLLALCTPAQAEDPPPGWQQDDLRRLSTRQDPLDPTTGSDDGLRRVLRDLAGEGRWANLAKAADRQLRGAGDKLAARQAAGARLGVRSDVIHQLQVLPPPALAAYRALRDQDAAELLAKGRSPDLRALLWTAPLASQAPHAARILGERALEAGGAEAALMWWRRASALDPAEAERLSLRVLAVRARSTPLPQAGGLGVPRFQAEPRPFALSWARETPGGSRGAPPLRAVTADSDRVYFTSDDVLLAADRADGRLAWRASAPGLDPAGTLLLGHGDLLYRGADGLRAFDPATGEERWSVKTHTLVGSKEDRTDAQLTDCAASAGGWVAMGRAGGNWWLMAVDAAGAHRWRTRLWEVRDVDATYSPLVARFAAVPGDPCREKGCPAKDQGSVKHHVERSRARLGVSAEGGPRRIRGDGRLATLGDRVLLTAGGFVAAADEHGGALLWLRERAFGLALASGGAVRVDLRATAYVVEAATSTGLLVRLDPLDGRLLDEPTSSLREAGPCYRLCPVPLVLGWKAGTRIGFADAEPSLELDPAPIWPGDRLGSALALPAAEGLLLWQPRGSSATAREPAGSEEREPERRPFLSTVPWPLGPARVVSCAGLLLLANERGIAVLRPGTSGPPPQIPASLEVNSLEHPRWRVRLAARQALGARLVGGDPQLAAELKRAAAAGSVELRTASAELLAAHGRLRRWQAILPKRSLSDLRPFAARALSAPQLRGVLEELPSEDPARAGAARALCEELLDERDPERGLALLDLLVTLDRRTRGSLTVRVRASTDAGVQRCAAEALVGLATRGGPRRALRALMRDVLENPANMQTSLVVRAVVESGDEDLWQELGGAELVPLPALRAWFRQAPAPDRNPRALFTELRPFLQRRAKQK